MVEIPKQPVTAEEIAQARHQARNMFKIVGVLVVLTILWAIIWSAPKILIIAIGVFGALGIMKWLAADKAEKAMHTETASAPATPVEEPMAATMETPAEPVPPTDIPPQA